MTNFSDTANVISGVDIPGFVAYPETREKAEDYFKYLLTVVDSPSCADLQKRFRLILHRLNNRFQFVESLPFPYDEPPKILVNLGVYKNHA